jgi:hypothetical protein
MNTDTGRYHPSSIVKISDETGAAAFLCTLDAMQAIYEELGDGYIGRAVRGLLAFNPKIIRLCMANMLRDTDMTADDILASVPVNVIACRLIDAIMIQKEGKAIFGDAA